MEADISADHHGGELLGRGVFCLDSSYTFALAQYGAAVGDGHYFVELVGDKQDALALGGKISHDLHEILDLLRSQNRSRLVENKYLIIAVEHFEYLGALLHTDGDILNNSVGLDMQPVLFAQLKNSFAGIILIENAEFACRLNTENDVVKYGKAFDQLKMLMNHSDTEIIRVIGVIYLNLNTVFFYRSSLRLIKTEKNAHKRRLSGSVFTEQGVNLTFFKLQGNVVVCYYTGKNLCDVQHFYCVLLIQNYQPPPVCDKHIILYKHDDFK